MWTKAKVEKFLKDNPIDTGGSLSPYEITKRFDCYDGDVYHIIQFPWWSNNEHVVKSLLKLLLKVMTCGNAVIYLKDSKSRFIWSHVVEVHFIESMCDPD